MFPAEDTHGISQQYRRNSIQNSIILLVQSQPQILARKQTASFCITNNTIVHTKAKIYNKYKDKLQ